MATAQRPSEARSRVGAYVEFAPPAALLGIVECSWVHVVAHASACTEGMWHRVLPDDALSLAFSCTRDVQGRAAEPHLGILGPVVSPRRYPIVGGREIVAVKVRPEWAPYVLNAFPADHADMFADATPLLPSATRDQTGRLAETRDWREALGVLWRIVAASVARRSDRLMNADAGQRALFALRRAPARAPVAWTAREMGLSPRHLRRVVIDAVGRSPLELHRTWRFLKALTLADASEPPRWAALAARCGYADQSHLVRDFRELTGETPERLAAERRRESQRSPAPQ